MASVPGVSEPVVSGVAQSVVSESQGSGDGGEDGGVVDEGSGGGDDPGASSEDGGVGLTLLPLLSGGLGGGGNGSEVGGGGLGDLRGQLRGNGELRVEDGGHERLRVEGGGNQRLGVEGGGDGETRVSDPEAGTISDVLDLLEDTSGVDVRVTSLDSSVGVADLLLGRVQVGVAVVQVAELILGVELAASVGRGSVGSRGVGRGGVGSGVPSDGDSVHGVREHGGAGDSGGHEGRDSDLKFVFSCLISLLVQLILLICSFVELYVFWDLRRIS